MHPPEPAIPPGITDPNVPDGPWWRELNRGHWFVLVVAALGWLFDTMDQQIFVLVKGPAMQSLLADPSEGRDVYYAGVAVMIFMIGWATGGLVFGLVGDLWGRARTMMLTILIYSFFTGLSALSQSWWDFAIYRFLTGVGVGGEFAAGVSLVAEVMPNRARPYALGLLQALSAIGNITAAVLSLLLPPQASLGTGIEGWRAMFLVGIVPALLVAAVFRTLKEPETWVRAREAARGKSNELRRQLLAMLELFHDLRWRRHTIAGVLLAMAGVMGLWGIGFWTPQLVVRLSDLPTKEQQDRYVGITMILQNLGGFFGIYAFAWLTGRTSRRFAFAVSYLLALAATVMVFGFLTTSAQIWWMIPILGFCTLMVFGGFAIYFPELYPTRLRATGTSFCYNVARYLSATAPFTLGTLTRMLFSADASRANQGLSDLTLLGSLGSVDDALRYAALIVSVVFLLGLAVLPFAPETRGKPLPE
jgi:MFS family permease